MRRLSLSPKRPRGVARRLRFLKRWAASFGRRWPSELTAEQRYCNWKVPILMNVVEGRHATTDSKVKCAQSLVDAAFELYNVKPGGCDHRVVASILLPGMFGSEVCVYSSKAYFEAHLSPDGADAEVSNPAWTDDVHEILGAISVPEGFGTKVVRFEYEDEDDRSLLHVQWNIHVGEISWR